MTVLIAIGIGIRKRKKPHKLFNKLTRITFLKTLNTLIPTPTTNT